MVINWSLIIPILILQLILQVLALVDLSKQSMEKNKKIIWVVIIILLNLLGPIVYFVFGRKEN